MLSTLFFDETDATSTLHVRTTRTHSANVSDVFQTCGSFNSGSIPVPPLRATLLWWLDRDKPLVHILLTSSTPGDVSYSCRKMSVEIPSPRGVIAACNVVHVHDHTAFAITWVTSQLEAGFLRLQVQRNSDHHSYLLLVPEGTAVLTSYFVNVASAFADGRSLAHVNDVGDEVDITDDSMPTVPLHVSIASSLPLDTPVNGLLSTVLLTDGFSMWRVELFEDGTFIEHEFNDLNSNGGDTVDGVRSGFFSSWIPSWRRGDKGGKRQRYLAVCPVQHTHYFVLLRCNGSLELYDSSLAPVMPVSPCTLERDEVSSSTSVLQWSALVDNDVHVVTCFGGREARHCVWSRIPIAATGGSPPTAAKMTVLPPAASSRLLGCVAVDPLSLTLLWAVNAEEDACMRCSLSVGSLLHSNKQNFSGILHFITAQEEFDTDTRSSRCVTAQMLQKEAQIFFCHSLPLHSLVDVGKELVLIESANGLVRAHVLASEISPFEKLLESAFAVGPPVAAATHHTLPLSTVHLIPAIIRENDRSLAIRTEAFDEGIELAASCADGADNLAALLISAVQCVQVASTLGGFQLLRSAAHLQGYTPSGFVNEAAINMAVTHSTTFFNVPSRRTSFCSFSRRFIQHTVCRDLLLRVAYLVCSFIGWLGSGVDYGKSPELPRLRLTLEILSAAYHAVSATGPSTVSIVSSIRETVVDDILKFLLQPFFGDESDCRDILFAVQVACQLRSCDDSLGPRACAVWCNLLSRRFPCLEHFRIVRSLEVGRSSRPSQLTAMCLLVSTHLSSCPTSVATALMLDSGVAPGGIFSLRKAFPDVSVEEWCALFDGSSNGGAIISSVYRAFLLRLLLHPETSDACVSGPVVRELFLTDVVQLEQCAQHAAPKCCALQRTLTELRREVHMFLAREALDQPNFGEVFHSLEEVLLPATETDLTSVYAERVLALLMEVVDVASRSDELIEDLVSVLHSSVELDRLLSMKWYSFIVRLSTKNGMELEPIRSRSSLGLCSPSSCLPAPDPLATKGPLTREHLPWLRRRHCQALCEQRLLDANRRVDCTDLWIENPPHASYEAAVRRFVEVLMETRLWREALRFASLAGYDVGVVLQNRVVDLLAYTDYTRDEEALEEWFELIEGCEEFSSLSNRYAPLRSTVVAALLYNYEKTQPALLRSLECADRYEALHALLEVFETLLAGKSKRMEMRMTINEEREDGPVNEVASHILESDNRQDASHQPWLLFVEALRVGTDILVDLHLSSEGGALVNEASVTAGVFDPMVRRVHELLGSTSLLEHPSLARAESLAKKFIESLESVKQARLRRPLVPERARV
uniref:Nucleoporin n=1 Tax=Trypanosoma vivax (strain Y486) TaxID=1055687 RepID=G0U7P5_TRYVY|nr:conserved hypothetical protein, fragment [Trypanosoma vivax Y486]